MVADAEAPEKACGLSHRCVGDAVRHTAPTTRDVRHLHSILQQYWNRVPNIFPVFSSRSGLDIFST